MLDLHLPTSGSHWPPPVLPYAGLLTRDRRGNGRAAPRKASRGQIPGILGRPLGIGWAVLEPVAINSTNRLAAVQRPFLCRSHLGPPSSVPN